jgi:hypothetical protein
MSSDPSTCPDEGAAPPPPIALDYHVPAARAGIDVTPYLGKTLAVALIVSGAAVFLIPRNLMQPLGLALAFAGFGWWAWCRRAEWPLLLRGQLLLAGLLCAANLLGIALSITDANPRDYAYWFTENQTYGLRRSRMLRPAWVSVAGVGWIILAATVHGARVLAGRRAGRNNQPPPEQE